MFGRFMKKAETTVDSDMVTLPISTVDAEYLVRELQTQIEEARDHGRMYVRIPSDYRILDRTLPYVTLEIRPTSGEYYEMSGRKEEE